MATYKANHVQFARLMKSEPIARVVHDEARRIMAHLRESAPAETGAYKNSFFLDSGEDVLEHDRAASFVVNDSEYATALEVGSWNIRNPPQPMTEFLRSVRDGR